MSWWLEIRLPLSGSSSRSLVGSSPLSNISRRLPIFRRLYTMSVSEDNHHKRHTTCLGPSRICQRASGVVTSNCSLRMLIWAASDLACQERKDKIFGLISLIDWGISGPLIPDYTQTEFEVAVSFFKALLNARYQDGTRPERDIIQFSDTVVDMLELKDSSPGVPSAVEARRFEAGICLAYEGTNLERINSKHSFSKGWRVSSGHLTKSESGFSTWSQPEAYLDKVYLPFWAQDDDWIVPATSRVVNGEYVDACVLVREVIEGFGGPLIGHAFGVRVPTYNYLDTREAPVPMFRIYWDTEDLVIHTIIVMQWMTRGMSSGSGGYLTESARVLNTAICRKETPGSSYALRCD